MEFNIEIKKTGTFLDYSFSQQVWLLTNLIMNFTTREDSLGVRKFKLLISRVKIQHVVEF